MSYSTPPNPDDSTRLNQAAAHDTGIYDPGVHDNHIVAMYETDERAQAAQSALTNAGVPASAIQMVSRGADSGTMGGVDAEDRDSGVWNSIRSLFAPENDRSDYSHAIGRGHAMLVVTPTASMDRATLIHTLESTDPVDFDAKLEEWRQAGYDTSTPHADYAASAGYGAGVTGGGYVDERSPGATAKPAMSNPMAQSTPTTAPMSGSAPSTTPLTAPAGMNAPTSGGAEPYQATPMTGADQRRTMTDTGRADDPNTIQVMEERLRVGKRETAGGAVRVRSYIVERPVDEQVTLHEEKVSIDRRPVDRPANQADFGAFQERTIEARATSEEAVVSKDARVVEEISLNKTGSDRVETVHDTVRKTEVEVEDGSTASTQKPVR